MAMRAYYTMTDKTITDPFPVIHLTAFFSLGKKNVAFKSIQCFDRRNSNMMVLVMSSLFFI